MLEILVVMALISGLVATSVSYLRRKESATRTFFNALLSINHTLDHKARLTGISYRLAFQIRGETEENKWWVEKQVAALDTAAKNEEEDPDGVTENPGQPSIDQPLQFVIDTSIYEEAQDFPEGLELHKVETSFNDKELTKGIAYVHFFPSGQFSKMLFHFRIGDNKQWSLLFDRILGDLDVFNGEKQLKELLDQAGI